MALLGKPKKKQDNFNYLSVNHLKYFESNADFFNKQDSQNHTSKNGFVEYVKAKEEEENTYVRNKKLLRSRIKEMNTFCKLVKCAPFQRRKSETKEVSNSFSQ